MYFFSFIAFLFFFLSFFSKCFGQEIDVYDYSTDTPLSGVHIYDSDKRSFVITDSLGIVDITKFNSNQALIFSHTSYDEIILTQRQLLDSDYHVFMKQGVINLEEFVVSANKRTQLRREVPNKIVSITNFDIKLNDPQTAADLIGSSGDVFIQKSQLGGGSPVIRGFSANKVLIVVDGVRMNNAIFRSGNLQNIISIDPNSVQSAEIIFGPGSVIYGSDALGGVMNFKTLPTHYSDSGTQYSGHAMFRFSSSNMELTPHFDVSVSNEKLSSVSSISFSSFSDLKMGTHGPSQYLRTDYVNTVNGVDYLLENDDSRLQKQSGYESFSVLQKFGFKVNDKIELKYDFIYSTTSDIPRYDRLIRRSSNDTLKYAKWDYGPQSWLSNHFVLDVHPTAVFF